jgi:hypothetical protein
MFLKVEKKDEGGMVEVVEVELSEKLQAALNIQKRFAKPFIRAAKEISSMGVEELIAFLSCGLKNTKPEEFRTLILENMGIADLYDAVTAFCLPLQYPGLSEDEIEKKVKAQQAKANRMNPGYQESSNSEPLSD